MKPVFIVAILAVAMIGVMVPSTFGELIGSTTIDLENILKEKERVVTEEEETAQQEQSEQESEKIAPLLNLMLSDENDELGSYVKSNSMYYDDFGQLHMIGEFVNNQNETLKFLKIIITFADRSGNILYTDYVYSDVDIIPPFTKTPFDMILKGNTDLIYSHKIETESYYGTTLPQKLELSPFRYNTNYYSETFEIDGTIYNHGKNAAQYTEIIITFYDDVGDIILTKSTYSDLDFIYPNTESTFQITIPEYTKPYIDSYSIFAQSQEYGVMYSLPEYTKQIKQNNSNNGGGCLIATTTYGSEMASEVQQLRELRDNQLLQTESGTAFMGMFNDVYYSFSPMIADYERENPYFKEAVKLAITPLISSLSILNYVDMNSESEVLGYGISLIILNLGMYLGIPAVVIIGIRKIK
jgi:hypothetical protein